MGLTVGPATWHPTFIGGLPLGSFICGGYLFRKADGVAWIVAPYSTQVGATWNGTTSTLVGDKPCVSDWSSLSTALTNAGLTPSQWFVPSQSTLVTIGYPCRSFWGDTSPCFSTAAYFSSTEFSSNQACVINFTNAAAGPDWKFTEFCIRAFRCVTY